jgi:hypothetical protein
MTWPSASNVDMVGQREIAEPEIARDVAERARKRVLRLQLPNVPDKCVYTTEHPPLRLRRAFRGRVFQVTAFPQAAFQPSAEPFSQAKGVDQGPSAAIMAGLARAFKYIHLLVA